MFKSNKKEKKVVKNLEVGVDQSIVDNIHTIPQRFYVAPKRSRVGLIIIVSIWIRLIVIGSNFSFIR